MTPQDLLKILPAVPFVHGGNSLTGMDCWGLVEYWYSNILNIELTERGEINSSCAGMLRGYRTRQDWKQVKFPQDHCGVSMDGYTVKGDAVKHGHCGVYFGGLVHHIDEYDGFQSLPLNHKLWLGRNLEFHAHKLFNTVKA